MSAAPISAADEAVPAPVRAALDRARWPTAAWTWERTMVAALQALSGGDAGQARDLLAAADRCAADGLPADDLRQVTARAGLALLEADRAALGPLAARWAEGERWVAGLRAGQGARSSLFHHRLETRHPRGYADMAAARLRRRWREGAGVLAAMQTATAGEAAEAAPQVLARWERTAARLRFGDERKIAAASCLLLAAAPADGNRPATS